MAWFTQDYILKSIWGGEDLYFFKSFLVFLEHKCPK